MKLSKYPKRGLSFSQSRDEEKLEKERKKHGIDLVCACGSKEFMITTLGIELCSKCFTHTGTIIL